MWPNGSGHVFVAISIHTLRVEGDCKNMVKRRPTYRFQSTPSAWRVTKPVRLTSFATKISIHTLRVEGDLTILRSLRTSRISIHTLRVEGDSKSAQKSRTLLFKVTDLRRNCRPDVHERTEGSLWQAVFAG